MCSGRAKSYRIVCKGPCGGLPEAERVGDSSEASDARPVLCPAQLGYSAKRNHRALFPALLNEKRKGTFVCAGCKAPLFDSLVKFESGTGNWARAGPRSRRSLRVETLTSFTSFGFALPSPWVRSFGAPIAAATSETCSTKARPLEERPPLNPGYGLGYGTP